MTRVIVHAGFHKTGTSSLQDYLRDNRDRLPGDIAIHLHEDFAHAGDLAVRFGQRPLPWRLGRFSRAFRHALDRMEDQPTHVFSWEGFSGIMPGHRRFGRPVRNFHRAAVPLALAIIRALRQRFGPDVEIVFFYTLREPEGWFASVHGHLLRSIRLTDDLATFRAGFSPGLRLDAEADRTARRIEPVPVVTSWLHETSSRPEGPAAALLDLLDLPQPLRASLSPARRTNSGNSPQLRTRFLELNRSVKNDRALRQLKAALTGVHRHEPSP